MELGDTWLAHAELGADVLELHALEVMPPHDLPLPLRELLDGLGEDPLLAAALGDLERIFFIGREVRGLLGRDDLLEAHHRGRSCAALVMFARDPVAGPPREPVLGTELVEDGAADTHPGVPLEAFALVTAVTAQGVDEPEEARRDQVVALDVRGQALGELPDDALDQGAVCRDPLLEVLLRERALGGRALGLFRLEERLSDRRVAAELASMDATRWRRGDRFEKVATSLLS